MNKPTKPTYYSKSLELFLYKNKNGIIEEMSTKFPNLTRKELTCCINYHKQVIAYQTTLIEVNMNIYKLTQTAITWPSNHYDSVVVIAENDIDAAKIHPNPESQKQYEDLIHIWGLDYDHTNDDVSDFDCITSSMWPAPAKVTISLIGTAPNDAKKGVVLASKNSY